MAYRSLAHCLALDGVLLAIMGRGYNVLQLGDGGQGGRSRKRLDPQRVIRQHCTRRMRTLAQPNPFPNLNPVALDIDEEGQEWVDEGVWYIPQEGEV